MNTDTDTIDPIAADIGRSLTLGAARACARAIADDLRALNPHTAGPATILHLADGWADDLDRLAALITFDDDLAEQIGDRTAVAVREAIASGDEAAAKLINDDAARDIALIASDAVAAKVAAEGRRLPMFRLALDPEDD